MAATSSILTPQFPLSTLYPDPQYPKPHYPEPYQNHQYQFKEPSSAHLGTPGYQYPYIPGYPPVEQQQSVPQWNFGAAIQGIVPEPERFGDLCEKGLVPIITTPTHEVNNTTPHNIEVKSEPGLKGLPQITCETTYVTTSQPLMCHSRVSHSATPMASKQQPLEYSSFTHCNAEQIDPTSYPGVGGGISWVGELDPFYTSDIRSTIPQPGHSSSGVIPSPWDFYRTSNT